jgi:hypothetical protein
MASDTKRTEDLMENTPAQPQQDASTQSLQNLFKNFAAEMQREMKAYRATSGERTGSNGAAAGGTGTNARPGTSSGNQSQPGRRDMMISVSEAMAQDIQSGGPLARSIQQTYAIGRKPTQR